MKRRFFLALLVLLLLPAYVLVGIGFNLMNQPDDPKLAAGILVLLAVFVITPTVLGYVYRKL